MTFRPIYAVAAAVLTGVFAAACDPTVATIPEDHTYRGSSRDLCPPAPDLGSDEFALRWRDDPAWSDSLAGIELYPAGAFRQEFRIRHLTLLPSDGVATCYAVFPLTFTNESDEQESFADASLWVRADHPVQNRDRRPVPFESGWYTYEVDLYRYRALQFRRGIQLDSSHSSNTWLRLRNDSQGEIRDVRTWLDDRVHIESMQPGETTEYVDVGSVFGIPSETSAVFGADTVRFMVTDRVGETPEPHGYYTFPMDSIGFWRYREMGTLLLDRSADVPE